MERLASALERVPSGSNDPLMQGVEIENLAELRKSPG
jgi:hypothetical protein